MTISFLLSCNKEKESCIVDIVVPLLRMETEVSADSYDTNRNFWLGHYFRDNYEDWHINFPQIVSGVAINNIEIYVINRDLTRSTREVVALMDLGEERSENIYRNDQNPGGYTITTKGMFSTDNNANDLLSALTVIPGYRNVDKVSGILENQFGFIRGIDFVKMGTARKLERDEFKLNKQLGYITLQRSLQNDEMLGVSYNYSIDGITRKVGEFSSDKPELGDNEVLILKMISPNRVDVTVPTWDLMMKNIYGLRYSNISDTLLEVQVLHNNGQDYLPHISEGVKTANIPLIELMKLDQLDENMEVRPDGKFDFVQGVTIDSRSGRIIFPLKEPFGSSFGNCFDQSEYNLIETYTEPAIYSEESSENSSYLIKVIMLAGFSEYISISSTIDKGSIEVFYDGLKLILGTDYELNYDSGLIYISAQKFQDPTLLTIRAVDSACN